MLLEHILIHNNLSNYANDNDYHLHKEKNQVVSPNLFKRTLYLAVCPV
jgi:hypothetical protein